MAPINAATSATANHPGNERGGRFGIFGFGGSP
jgi:hypothetical protein